MYFIIAWILITGACWYFLQKYDYAPFYYRGISFPAWVKMLPIAITLGTFIFVVLVVFSKRFIHIQF